MGTCSMAGAGGFSTRCIHAGEAPDPTTGAHGVPLYQNVTFAFETYSQVGGHAQRRQTPLYVLATGQSDGALSGAQDCLMWREREHRLR